jgi:hypothetical protein
MYRTVDLIEKTNHSPMHSFVPFFHTPSLNPIPCTYPLPLVTDIKINQYDACTRVGVNAKGKTRQHGWPDGLKQLLLNNNETFIQSIDSDNLYNINVYTT